MGSGGGDDYRREGGSQQPLGAFSLWPAGMAACEEPEGQHLRQNYMLMLAVHVVSLILELIFMNWVLLMLLGEALSLYLCYVSYMTLNAVFAYCYMFLMFLTPLTGLLRLFQVGFGLPTLFLIGICAADFMLGGMRTY